MRQSRSSGVTNGQSGEKIMHTARFNLNVASSWRGAADQERRRADIQHQPAAAIGDRQRGAGGFQRLTQSSMRNKKRL